MFGKEVPSCTGGTDLCKLLVENVQSCLGEKRMDMLKVIRDSRHDVARYLSYNHEKALESAGYIFEDEWCISAFNLIDSCCGLIMSDLFSRRSDDGESSQYGVHDAISSLVYLARRFYEFDGLRELGKHLENPDFCEISGSASMSSELHYLFSTYFARNVERRKIVEEIANERRWNLPGGMIYVKMIFDEYRIIFQTLLFISEVCSYGLNLTAENNIIILVPILVLSATCFLFINIPLIWRCCRKRTEPVVSQIEWVESAFSEWVESSFSIVQLVADILKVAGHAESSSKVTEAWVLVFAVIGYVFFLIKRNTNVDGGRSNRGGIRRWIRRTIKKIKRRYRLNDPCILEDRLEV